MKVDPYALAPIAISLASATAELWAVAEMRRGATVSAVVVAALAGWAGLVLAALAGLALREDAR